MQSRAVKWMVYCANLMQSLNSQLTKSLSLALRRSAGEILVQGHIQTCALSLSKCLEHLATIMKQKWTSSYDVNFLSENFSIVIVCVSLLERLWSSFVTTVLCKISNTVIICCYCHIAVNIRRWLLQARSCSKQWQQHIGVNNDNLLSLIEIERSICWGHVASQLYV